MRTFTLLLVLLFTICAADVEAQYCMLPGRTSYSIRQPGIINFKLNAINRTSSNVEKPLNQPSLVVTTDSTVLQRGKTYVVRITHTMDTLTPAFANARNNIRLWVDYNGDQDFIDAGETAVSADTIWHGLYIDSFTVPANAKLGATRLRVTAKMSFEAGHSFPTSCDDPKDPIDYHGEMEDYTVTIVAPNSVQSIVTNEPVVSVYPNPTTGSISLAFSTVSSEELSVNLYDLTGKHVAVLLQTSRQDKAEYVFQLDNYNIHQGIYIMQVNSGSTVSYQRIAKVN